MQLLDEMLREKPTRYRLDADVFGDFGPCFDAENSPNAEVKQILDGTSQVKVSIEITNVIINPFPVQSLDLFGIFNFY